MKKLYNQNKDAYNYRVRIGLTWFSKEFNVNCRLNYLKDDYGMITIRDTKGFFDDADYVIFDEVRYTITKRRKVSKNLVELSMEREGYKSEDVLEGGHQKLKKKKIRFSFSEEITEEQRDAILKILRG